METKNNIKVSVIEFSKSPGPRYDEQGENSGERFYLTVLKEAFRKAQEEHTHLIVNLDGVDGYASSFIDEAFGNLVYEFGANQIREILEVVSKEEPEWERFIRNEVVLNWERRRIEKKAPKRTMH